MKKVNYKVTKSTKHDFSIDACLPIMRRGICTAFFKMNLLRVLCVLCGSICLCSTAFAGDPLAKVDGFRGIWYPAKSLGRKF